MLEDQPAEDKLRRKFRLPNTEKLLYSESCEETEMGVGALHLFESHVCFGVDTATPKEQKTVRHGDFMGDSWVVLAGVGVGTCVSRS